MKHLKTIFLGKVGMFPLWLGYIIVGGIINTSSTSGMNGDMGEWQIDHVWPAWVGFIIMAIAIPGVVMFLWFILNWCYSKIVR